MEAASYRTDVHSGPTRGQRIGQLLLIVVAGLVLAAALYYAMTIVRSTTFSTDRGFRVLDEAIGQFENLQDSMASLLKLVPSIPECGGLGPRERSGCIRSRYQARLDVPGLKLEDRVEDRSFASCTQPRREEFLLRLDEPRIGFTIYPCSVAAEDPGSKYVLRGSFARSLERFNSQRFFDETLYSLASGTVLAELTPPGESAHPADTHLQDTHAPSLMVTDASHLLRRAASEAVNAGKAATSKGAEGDRSVPAHPIVFGETIAGQKYRVFVVAFRPTFPVYAATGSGDAGPTVQRQEFVYLIGLKRDKLGAALAYALWPNGTFAITLAALLAMLFWPLAGLRLSAPQDPISRGEALAVMTALILIPALLTIAVVWAWSHRTLQGWADEGAAEYAQQIERALVADLEIGSNLLDEYRRQVYASDLVPCSAPSSAAKASAQLQNVRLPLRPSPHGLKPDPWVRVPLTAEQGDTSGCGVYYLWTSDTEGGMGSWSPLRTALALDQNGDKIGPRLSAYGAVPQRPALNLADRSYFEALKNERGWQIQATAPWQRPPEHGVVAQRLFSRADAARTLQIAVPRCSPTDVFCGIVTGDSRVHALTAKLDPPLLRFAVIDRESGTVLFHSDDSRSLAENFFTETERDPDLHAAVRLNATTHFGGRYLGDPHRFYFRPVSGAPWGVVVFYPMKTLGDLPLQAGVAALTAYAGIALLLLAIVGVLLFSESAPTRRVLSYLWPQWRWRHIYRWLGWALMAGALLVTLVAFAFLRTDHGVAALSAAIAVPVATTWIWQRARRGSNIAARALSVRSYERAYIRCVVGSLFFIAVLPAAWLSLWYHDAQIHGFLREATQRATLDVERRHALIAHDLQRWVPNSPARLRRYPDPWALTELSVPGYEFANGRWTLQVFRTMPWARIDGPSSLGAWHQQAWRAAAQSAEQLRRVGLLAANAPVTKCTDDTSKECYRATAADAHAIEVATPITLNNGTRALSERVTSPLLLAGVGVLIVSFLLSALVARRFFGVGMPFSGRYLPVLSIDDNVLGGSLLYRPRSDSLRSHRLAPEVLRATLLRIAPSHRFDLSFVALDQPVASAPGNYLLINLDIALLEPTRRQFVLAQLENMLAQPEVGVYVTCEKPPAQWLYRNDAHPESRADQRLELQEELRWDNVFARLSLINLRRGVQATDRRTMVAPALRDARLVLDELYERNPQDLTDKDRADYLIVHADMHYHRAWKLCTRDERLLLHQLATGRFANPANHQVTERLIRAGLVALDPWPRLTDAGFGRYIRTAETRHDFTEWQKEASQGAWKNVRTPLLIVMLIVVGWLIWTAGDYVQAFSAILVAAVALLGQVGQVVNLVRGSVAQKS